MHAAPEILFAQKLAANEKRIRDRAVKKLKKWLAVRSSSIKSQLTQDDMLKLWKGLFYCMWMSDKPLIQEELARTISDIIHCFNNKDAALLFIKEFFETVNREWPRIDYLRMDKFMMFVRCFLNQCFEFLHKLNWDEELKIKLLDILNTTVINPKSDDACVGLQLHVSDIYVEELVKVAADELSGKQLTGFLLPYCHLLAACRNPTIRKTVVHRVFEFTMRLSDSDDEAEEDEDDNESKDGGELSNENGEASNAESQLAEDTVESEEEEDDEMIGSGIDEDDEEEGRGRLYGEFQGEFEFLRKVKKHEMENLKLPVPEFDYQDIGDTLFEIVGKSQIKQKFRNQNYSLVKKFHEMAKGIYPLDLVETSLGKRLSTKDIEAAAKRLLMEREAEMLEDLAFKVAGRKRKRKLPIQDSDLDESEQSADDEDESDHQKGDDMKKSESPQKKRVKLTKQGKKGVSADGDEMIKSESPQKKRVKLTKQEKKSGSLMKKTAKPLRNGTETKPELKKRNHSTNRLVTGDKLTERLVSNVKATNDAMSDKHLDLLPEVKKKKRNRKKRNLQQGTMTAGESVHENTAVSAKVTTLSDVKSAVGSTLSNQPPRKKRNRNRRKIKHGPMILDESSTVPTKVTAVLDVMSANGSHLSESLPGKSQLMATTDKLLARIEAKESACVVDTLEVKLSPKKNPKKRSVERGECADGLTPSTVAKTQSEEKHQGKCASADLNVDTLNSTVEMTTCDSPAVEKCSSSSNDGETVTSFRLSLHRVDNNNPTLMQAEMTPQETVKELSAMSDGTAAESKSVMTPEMKTGNENKVAQSAGDSSSKKRVSFTTLSTTPLRKRKPECKTSKVLVTSIRRSSRIAKTNDQPSSENTAQGTTPKTDNTMSRKKERYFNPKISIDSSVICTRAVLAAKKASAGNDVRISATTNKYAKKAATGSDFIKFEEFVQTPPAFFRKAVTKVSRNSLSKAKKGAQDKGDDVKSFKKVNFQLTCNSAHGTQEYADSIRNSPGIPYDASKQPTQSVLKLNTAADTGNRPTRQKSD